MILYFVIGIGILIGSYFMYKVWQIKKELEEWDPFGFNDEMTTELECPKCGYLMKREFIEGDFVFGETEDKCNCVCKKLKCEKPMIVKGIYYCKPKTKEELKWEKLEAKWR